MKNFSEFFPELTQPQLDMFGQLGNLYKSWNAQINVVSRKDIDNIEVHHILHSLAIAKVIQFGKGTHIMDVGTGGGLPGIPLAIMFPNCYFTLVDSIGKKVKVAQEIVNELGLKNVKVENRRAESIASTFDFVVSRAVAPLPTLMGWVKKSIRPGGCNSLPNGVICLKGGDLSEEIRPYHKILERWNINDFFDDPFFEEKYVLFVPMY